MTNEDNRKDNLIEQSKEFQMSGKEKKSDVSADEQKEKFIPEISDVDLEKMKKLFLEMQDSDQTVMASCCDGGGRFIVRVRGMWHLIIWNTNEKGVSNALSIGPVSFCPNCGGELNKAAVFPYAWNMINIVDQHVERIGGKRKPYTTPFRITNPVASKEKKDGNEKKA